MLGGDYEKYEIDAELVDLGMKGLLGWLSVGQTGCPHLLQVWPAVGCDLIAVSRRDYN